MIKTRFQILLDHQVISQRTFILVMKVYSDFVKKYDLNDESCAVFLTHLAMAIERVVKQETPFKMDDAIVNEIKNQPHFHQVNRLTNELLQLVEYPLPNEEIEFIWLHLSSILEKEGNYD